MQKVVFCSMVRVSETIEYALFKVNILKTVLFVRKNMNYIRTEQLKQYHDIKILR